MQWHMQAYTRDRSSIIASSMLGPLLTGSCMNGSLVGLSHERAKDGSLRRSRTQAGPKSQLFNFLLQSVDWTKHCNSYQWHVHGMLFQNLGATLIYLFHSSVRSSKSVNLVTPPNHVCGSHASQNHKPINLITLLHNTSQDMPSAVLNLADSIPVWRAIQSNMSVQPCLALPCITNFFGSSSSEPRNLDSGWCWYGRSPRR